MGFARRKRLGQEKGRIGNKRLSVRSLQRTARGGQGIQNVPINEAQVKLMWGKNLFGQFQCIVSRNVCVWILF